jgi:hypothetical protein
MIDIIRDDSLFCRIYIENTGKWIDGILTYVNLNKNVADIFVPNRHFRSFLSEGCKVIVKSLDSNSEYIFSGTISHKIVSIRKQSVTFKIDDVVKFDNERLFERFICHYPSILKLTKSQFSSSGILLDISSGGILIASPSVFEPNSTVNVEIFFANEHPIAFTARILRKNQSKIGYNYGMIIEDINNENAIILNKLIENLVSEKRSIINELRFFKKMKNIVYFVISLIGLILLSLYLKNI